MCFDFVWILKTDFGIMCFHFVWIFKPDFGIMCLYLVDAVVLVDGTGEVGLVELTLIGNIS